jgi:hypothetical protein
MARTNTNDPDLSLWIMSFKAIASRNFTGIDFKGSGFEVVGVAYRR